MTLFQNALGSYWVKAKRSESPPLPLTHTSRYMLQNANAQSWVQTHVRHTPEVSASFFLQYCNFLCFLTVHIVFSINLLLAKIKLLLKYKLNVK